MGTLLKSVQTLVVNTSDGHTAEAVKFHAQLRQSAEAVKFHAQLRQSDPRLSRNNAVQKGDCSLRRGFKTFGAPCVHLLHPLYQ